MSSQLNTGVAENIELNTSACNTANCKSFWLYVVIVFTQK